jgi:hypothetical protein
MVGMVKGNEVGRKKLGQFEADGGLRARVSKSILVLTLIHTAASARWSKRLVSNRNRFNGFRCRRRMWTKE